MEPSVWERLEAWLHAANRNSEQRMCKLSSQYATLWINDRKVAEGTGDDPESAVAAALAARGD